MGLLLRTPNRLFLYLLVGILSFVPSAAWSGGDEDSYPIRPISMIVPLAPGGGADLGSRVVADRIAEVLGQRLVSVHKPGGGGALGSTLVAKARPDGYTILAGGSSAVILQMIVRKAEYGLDDLRPVGIWGRIPHMLVVKADSKWKTLEDFIADAKKSPGMLKVSSYGKLTLADFLIMSLNRYTGITVAHVPFKSSGEAIQAVLGGHVEAASVSGVGGLFETGLLRVLALSADRRSEEMPDVPTFGELGFPIVLTAFYSMYFPKDTPERIIRTFASAQQTAVSRYAKDIKESLRRVEISAEFRSYEETQKIYRVEYEALRKLASEFGVVAR